MSDSIANHIHGSVHTLARLMINRQLKLTIAESCTGGMFAQKITALSGSSKWFECGFVTYSNESKIRLLGVQAKVLDEYGAVSEEVARQMALGAMRYGVADLAVSITGIAGPEGGVAGKPVGSVYIAIADLSKQVHATHYLFAGDRDTVRQQSTHAAVVQLIECLS